MTEIIPAILPKSFEELSEAMAQVSGLVKMVQVDVCDGVFVKNKTWPYVQKNDPDFADILKENGGFPYWEEMDFEVDLMIKPTEEEIQKWITAGAKRLIIHVESVENPELFVEKIRNLLPEPDSAFHIEIGIAISIDTPNDVLKHVVKHVDFIQCMGIAHIGHQGEPFDPAVLEKINELRVLHPNVTISVDGAVNEESAPQLIDAGATRLVIGSAIFGGGDVPGTIEFFQDLAEVGREGESDN